MPFFLKFLSFHPFLVYLAFIAILFGFGITMILVTRYFFDFRTRSGQLHISSHLFGTVGAIFAVLLAFVTVIVWEQFNKSADNADKEANAALAMYRDLRLYYDREQANQAEQSLLAFIHNVIEDEYPAMAKMQRSQLTAHAIERLWADVQNLKVQDLRQQSLFNEILRNMNNVSELRAGRLRVAETYNLLGIMRLVLILGAFIVIVFAVLFGPEKFWWNIFMASLLALLIATMFFVLEDYEFPFAGSITVKPDGYINVLKIINQK